jgi:hypothetical protein
LRGDDRSDARLVEQPWCQCADVPEQLAFEFGGFEGDRFDSVGEAAQHEPHRELVRACRA